MSEREFYSTKHSTFFSKRSTRQFSALSFDYGSWAKVLIKNREKILSEKKEVLLLEKRDTETSHIWRLIDKLIYKKVFKITKGVGKNSSDE